MQQSVLIDVRQQRLHADGAAVGFAASSSETFDFVPAFGFKYLFANSDANYTVFGQSGSASALNDYGVSSAAAGFIFNKAVTLRPSVAIPMNVEGGKAAYGIAVGFNFGNK